MTSDPFSGFFPALCALGDRERLTFLHGMIPTRRHGLCAPETHIYMAGLLDHHSLTVLPPPDQADTACRALVERSDDVKGRDGRQALACCVAETDRTLDLFSGFLPELCALGDSETLTFLHGMISTRRHGVCAPETPIYLNGLLADTPLTGGLEPMLGAEHLRTLTILGFPGLSRPGLLYSLRSDERRRGKTGV